MWWPLRSWSCLRVLQLSVAPPWKETSPRCQSSSNHQSQEVAAAASEGRWQPTVRVTAASLLRKDVKVVGWRRSRRTTCSRVTGYLWVSCVPSNREIHRVKRVYSMGPASGDCRPASRWREMIPLRRDRITSRVPPTAVHSQTSACSVVLSMGRMRWSALRATAQVTAVRQFRHALVRVAFTEPSGQMWVSKARDMASMEGPTSSARLRKVASQLPCASCRADDVDESRSMALQSAHLHRTMVPRAASKFATVGMELVVHSRAGARAGPTAMMTADLSAWRCISNIGPMPKRGAELGEDASPIGLILD